MTKQGTIIKGVGGRYTVKTANGTYICSARGKFRINATTPLVGDSAKIEVVGEAEKTGYLLEIAPRKNELTRPRSANADVILAVFSAQNPSSTFEMIDDLLLTCEYTVENCLLILCLNKVDGAPIDKIESVRRVYGGVYEVFPLSAATGGGIEPLKARLSGKTVIMAGPSGVGKSSLLNAIVPAANAQTGALSLHIERGKHTTRHAELFETDFGALIADTPGFSSVTADVIPKGELARCFPEFREFLGLCRYTDCSHITEDGCAVKGAVGTAIAPERYERYVNLRTR